MGTIEITLGLLLAVALVGAAGKLLPVRLPKLRETDVINDEMMRTTQSDLDPAESPVAGPGREPA